MTKDRAWERNKPYYVKTRVSALANFEVGRLIKRMEKSAIFCMSLYCSSVFYLVESYIVYKHIQRPCHVSEKAYNCPVREISFVKANGRVGAIPTYRIYRLYDYE